MFLSRNRYLRVIYAASIVCAAMGMSKMTQDAPKDPVQSGCEQLREVSAHICRARVNCAPYAHLTDEARTLYARCEAGDPVSLAEVEALFEKFGGTLNYACCIGNALFQEHTGS